MKKAFYKFSGTITAWAFAIGGGVFFILLFSYPLGLFDVREKIPAPFDFLYGLALVVVATILPKLIVLGLRRTRLHSAVFSFLVFFWVMNGLIAWLFILRK